MKKRFTILLDDKLLNKLRELQARRIKTLEKSVSLSNVVNEVLYEGLKHIK